MNIQSTINFHQEQLAKAIANIPHFPEGLLPHIVYIEEEGEDRYPVYNRYRLLEVFKDGSCMVKYAGQVEKRQLTEINIDWLITVWNYYKDLILEEQKKELSAFLYPIGRFPRNASDDEIISDWLKDEGQDPCTEKLTPDELAARINDEGFDNTYYIRFIKY